jgi:ABC-type antimicrobial peptide transport system permease subunit
MVREVMRQLDASLPLADVRSLAQWRRVRSIGIQYVAALMAAFGAIGLFLAAVGIYGVMAYSVNQRTRELGVRIALGATGSQVMGMTLRQALVLSLVGITVGSVAAFALARVMVSTLFGVIQMDVVMFVAFAVMLLAVALVASGVPARRAMRVDPIAALRAE